MRSINLVFDLMRNFYSLSICLIFCSQIAWSEFNPIVYTYSTNSDKLDLSYLTKSEFLYIPNNVQFAILDYTSDEEIDQEYSVVDPKLTAIILANKDYTFTQQQFMAYRNNNHLYVLSEKSTLNTQIKRQQSFDKANKILALFIHKYPDLRIKLESSAAYGIFEVTSFNTLIYAGGFGSGIVFDNVEKTTRYVDTFRAGTGLGLGYISNYTLIIFHKHFALEQYFGAGGAGGDVGGSGTVGIWNRSVSFNPTISTYHIFHYGADLQVNWGGTLYWLSPILN